MQSPDIRPELRSIDAERLRTRAIGIAFIAVLVLALPALAAGWFYLMTVAAHSYHAFIAALYGVS